MNFDQANFNIGQVIIQPIFKCSGSYVNPHFLGSKEWCRKIAHSRPPKDRPWHHVLVHGAEDQTYVVEHDLEADDTGQPIHHSLGGDNFKGLDEGHYTLRQKGN